VTAQVPLAFVGLSAWVVQAPSHLAFLWFLSLHFPFPTLLAFLPTFFRFRVCPIFFQTRNTSPLHAASVVVSAADETREEVGG
jgi:hypothetical protein